MFLATVLLVVGLMIPLLLNGQTFTNSIVGIVFLIASAILCVVNGSRADADDDRGISRRIVFYLAVFVIVVLILQMPANREFQSRFNESVQSLRDNSKQELQPPDQQVPDP